MALTTTASFSSGFSAPFFGGVTISAESPQQFPVSIGGHPYLVDLDHASVETIAAWFREESLPLLRQQSDDSTEPGAGSISPEQMWRRSQESWHHGAGQDFYDREESDRNRFRESKGVDPWTKWQLGLLNQTERTETFSGGSGSSIVSTGDRAYVSSGGNNFRTSDDLGNWVNVTGIPGTNCTSLTTDGSNVYSAWGTNGIYSTVAGTTTAASFATTAGSGVYLVAYVKGRLIAAQGNALHNQVTGGGALAAAFYTHPNTNWIWTGLAEGDGFIYAAGFAGSFSAVYKIEIQPDGTGLNPGVHAGAVPLGETIRSIHGYLGFILLGTDEGVRFCAVTDSGDLRVGAAIPTPAPVRCFTSFGPYTWFGWSSFDLTSSGLGRLDLQVINDDLTPAYASDLMATATGTVNGVATISGLRVFVIDGSGVWVEQPDTPVLEGFLTTGEIGYGIADAKVAVFTDIRHLPLPVDTDIEVSLSTDGSSFLPIGESAAPGSIGPPSLSAQQKRGETFELMFTLATETAAEPVLRRWMLRSLPAPSRIAQWSLPLIWREVIELDYGATRHMDVATETSFIKDRHETQEVVAFQLGPNTFQVVISDYRFYMDRLIADPITQDAYVWTGTMSVELREISG